MKSTSLLAVAVAMALSTAACSQSESDTAGAEKSEDTTMAATENNPLFTQSDLPYLVPAFDRIRNEHYLPAFEKGMEEHLAEIEAIANNPEEPTFEAPSFDHAPMPEAQLLETRILNLVHFQSVIASKAARVRLAAPGKGLIDFGLRRAHGAEAGLYAARASYLAGFDGTATAAAAPRFGIPVFGTMAHSFVQAHESEAQAFEHFAAAFPDNTVLLVDTYDTLEGVRKAVRVPGRLKGVRLDSGDLDSLSREARKILDQSGNKEAIIFASGNLDEERVGALVRAGAPIDSFGVGTALTTSADAPYLDAVYKLQEYAGRPRRKRSTGKATWPGRKQVYRCYGADGRFAGDVVTLEGDARAGEPLLQPVMRGGRRLPQPGLAAARQHCLAQLARLPVSPYRAEIAPALRALAEEVDRDAG